jgi:NAD(P)-dependent dehydrogenase (short-subunit alcohol dehydrogenase family)
MGTVVDGATAVVTGGQKGLGKAIVDELLARGATTVYATSRRPEATIDQRVLRLGTDITDGDSVTALAHAARDATIVVNNAGLLGGESLLDSDFADIRNVVEINLFGTLRVARAFAPILAANDGGPLSTSHRYCRGRPVRAYGSTKAALWSATNSLRLNLVEQGINVIGVYLAYTDTAMVADLDVPKNDPADVARQIVDGIESGAAEVLADDITRSAYAGAPGAASN